MYFGCMEMMSVLIHNISGPVFAGEPDWQRQKLWIPNRTSGTVNFFILSYSPATVDELISYSATLIFIVIQPIFLSIMFHLTWKGENSKLRIFKWASQECTIPQNLNILPSLYFSFVHVIWFITNRTLSYVFTCSDCHLAIINLIHCIKNWPSTVINDQDWQLEICPLLV